MSHTPPPWAVDTYSDGFDPDGDKDMNGGDYGKGDSVLIKIAYPIIVIGFSVALMTIGGNAKMSVSTYFGGLLAVMWLVMIVMAVAGAIVIGAQDYKGLKRLKHIVIIAVCIVLFAMVSGWFMMHHSIAI